MSRLSLLVIVCLIASIRPQRLDLIDVDNQFTDPEDQTDYASDVLFSKRADVVDRKPSVSYELIRSFITSFPHLF